MTRFVKMALVGDRLVEVEAREIPQSKLAQCPHYILAAIHYREDGSCKCDDPNETIMREWGYCWSKRTGRWQ